MKHVLFTVACLSCLGVRSVAQESTPVTITIDLSQPSQPISPLIFGQFIEHLGRAIDGGIYEEDSPLSDDRGFRTDVLEKAQGLDIPLLRYPRRHLH